MTGVTEHHLVRFPGRALLPVSHSTAETANFTAAAAYLLLSTRSEPMKNCSSQAKTPAPPTQVECLQRWGRRFRLPIPRVGNSFSASPNYFNASKWREVET